MAREGMAARPVATGSSTNVDAKVFGTRTIADVLGHRDPAFTMRVYAHAMRDEETDLSVAETGREASADAAATSPNVSMRLQALEPRLGYAGECADSLVGRPGLEPGRRVGKDSISLGSSADGVWIQCGSAQARCTGK